MGKIENKKIIDNTVTVTGSETVKVIEELAGSFSIADNRKFKSLQLKVLEPSVTRDIKEEYITLLCKGLAWDLVYNDAFDGNLTGWGLIACGVIPAEFKDYRFAAEELAVFARSYVNYYMSQVAPRYK